MGRRKGSSDAATARSGDCSACDCAAWTAPRSLSLSSKSWLAAGVAWISTDICGVELNTCAQRAPAAFLSLAQCT